MQKSWASTKHKHSYEERYNEDKDEGDDTDDEDLVVLVSTY